MTPVCAPAWRAGFIATLTALAAGPWAPVQAQPVYAVDREQANVRQNATPQAPLLGILRQGEQVVEVRRHERWLEVRLPDGRTGWIHAALLQPRLVVEGQGVRIRSQPTTQGRSVTMLFRGQEVGRLQERGAWTQVRLEDGRTGWLSSRYVRAKTEQDLRQERPAVAADEALAVPEPEAVVEAEPGGAAVPPGAADAAAILQRNPYADGLRQEADGRHLEALQSFTEVLESDPTHLNALVHAAQAHRNLGQYEQALAKLYRALDLTGGRKDVYLTLGEVYRLSSEPDSAAKYQALFRGEGATADGPAEGRPDEVAAGGAPAATAGPAPAASDADAEALEAEARDAEAPDAGLDDAGLFRAPWVLVGLGGIALLALAAIAWWIASGSSSSARVPADGGRFGKVWHQEEKEARQGRATPEEEAELDRQIEGKWRELRASAEAFTGVAGGGEADGVDRVLDQMEGLRQILESQEERARLYADIVRLQNMKIDAMTDEIRRLRTRGKA